MIKMRLTAKCTDIDDFLPVRLFSCATCSRFDKFSTGSLLSMIGLSTWLLSSAQASSSTSLRDSHSCTQMDLTLLPLDSGEEARH